jgi:hypothetical protein
MLNLITLMSPHVDAVVDETAQLVGDDGGRTVILRTC